MHINRNRKQLKTDRQQEYACRQTGVTSIHLYSIHTRTNAHNQESESAQARQQYEYTITQTSTITESTLDYRQQQEQHAVAVAQKNFQGNPDQAQLRRGMLCTCMSVYMCINCDVYECAHV
jgi:hypothetical protein